MGDEDGAGAGPEFGEEADAENDPADQSAEPGTAGGGLQEDDKDGDHPGPQGHAHPAMAGQDGGHHAEGQDGGDEAGQVVGIAEGGEDVVVGVPLDEVHARVLVDIEAVELDEAVDDDRHGRRHHHSEERRERLEGEALGQGGGEDGESGEKRKPS